MSRQIKRIVAIFLASNLIGLIGVVLFTYGNVITFARILMAVGIILNLTWFVMLILFLIKAIGKKHQQVS